MSLFVKRGMSFPNAAQMIADRTSARTHRGAVSSDSAMRHSAVWACLRLRANLISTLPVDAYRDVQGRPVEVPKPPVLVNPGGERVDILEWLYSTQVDLDRSGNTFGLITERDGRNLPRRIDLVPCAEVTVEVRKGELSKYRIAGVRHDPSEVWHERQYPLSGLHVGLSPVAYAAWSIGEYLSVQEFALDWFSNSNIPAARLMNTKREVDQATATTIKQRYKASVSAGDIFVHGNDWDFQIMGAKASESNWIEAKNFGIGDVARFFDVPGDMIDAPANGSAVTYANITQRNLQLLIMHLGPAIVRRERALSKLLASPRYVKFNTDALLRMDPKAAAELLQIEINSRTLAPSEVRRLKDREPFTEEQLAEFDRLFGSKNQQPTTGGNR